MAIQFFFLEQKFVLTQRRQLKLFITEIFKQHKQQLQSLTYVFCSDKYLLSINKKHLQHDYYTDIITFDLSEKAGEIIGEIYISIDRVRDNATTHQVGFKEEIHRVVFHGALHLCGYKDKKPAEAKAMRTAENSCLSNYFKGKP
jgi:probable rRNA maturation factor